MNETNEIETLTEEKLIHVLIYGELTPAIMDAAQRDLMREAGTERIVVKMVANGNRKLPDAVQDLARWQIIGDLQTAIKLANQPMTSSTISPNGKAQEKGATNGNGIS